jgi:hypothetical protein
MASHSLVGLTHCLKTHSIELEQVFLGENREHECFRDDIIQKLVKSDSKFFSETGSAGS